MPRGRGVQEGTVFGEVPSPKISEGKKMSKIWRDFRQLSPSIANISRTDPRIENRKSKCQLQPLPRWVKKDSELWSINKKVIGAHVDPPKWNFGAISDNFPTFHFDSPGGVAASGIVTTQNCLCSPTCGAGRPYIGLCTIFLVCYSSCYSKSSVRPSVCL